MKYLRSRKANIRKTSKQKQKYQQNCEEKHLKSNIQEKKTEKKH